MAWRWTQATIAGLGGVTLALAACDDPGSLTLRLDLPTDLQLRPAGMTTVTVETRAPDEPTRVVTTPIEFDQAGHGTFDVGELPRLPSATVTVALRTAAGRLVGYGAASDAVDLSEGADVALSIPVRRPLIYVGNRDGGDLRAMDPTRDTTDTSHQTSIDLGTGRPRAILALDGARMAVVTGTSVQVFDTASHQAAGPARSVPADVADAAVAADGWIVLAHPGGVTALDLDDGAELALVDDRAITRVAVGLDAGVPTVFALDDRVLAPGAPDEPCQGAAQVLAVPVAGGTVRELAAGAFADVAAAPGQEGAFAVDACADAIVTAEDGTKIAEVERPSHLVRIADTLWAAGNRLPTIVDDNGTPDNFADDVIIGGSIQLVSVAADGGGRRRIDLPAQSQVLSNLDDPAHELSNILQADAVRPLDMAVLPANEGVALITEMTATTTALVGSEEYIPPMEVSVFDMKLVDVASATITQQIRLACDPVIDDTGNPTFGEWECAAAPAGTAPAGGQYEPSAIGTLFGAT